LSASITGIADNTATSLNFIIECSPVRDLILRETSGLRPPGQG
jgi:hypothetical protein